METTESTDFNAEQESSPSPEASSATARAATDDEKYKALYDQHLRLAADFENFRKRHHSELDAMRKYSAESTLEELLPVLDNLDRAATSLSEESPGKILFQSFRLLQNQLLEALTTIGLKRLDSTGAAFDPTLHEAISQVETDDQPEDTVIQEFQSGYMYKDRLLRPARVAVSVSNAPKTADNPFSHMSDRTDTAAQ